MVEAYWDGPQEGVAAAPAACGTQAQGGAHNLEGVFSFYPNTFNPLRISSNIFHPNTFHPFSTEL